MRITLSAAELTPAWLCCPLDLHPLRFLDLEPEFDTFTVEWLSSNGTYLRAGRFSRLSDLPSSILRLDSSSVVLRLQSDAAMQYSGFVVQFTVRSPEPAAALDGTSPSAANNNTLCSPMFVMHGAGYYTDSKGGYVTNDLAWRRRQADIIGDGSSRAPVLPDLPSDNPSTWLQPYTPNTQCSWSFTLPANAYATLWLEYLDVEADTDYLMVLKPRQGSAVGDLVALAQFTGRATRLNVQQRSFVYDAATQGSTTFYVSFRSDMAVQLSGFILRCVLASHLHPRCYTPCTSMHAWPGTFPGPCIQTACAV